jgi:hypothetical protein
MIRALVYLALLVLAVFGSQLNAQSQASLQETLQWMQDTLKPTGVLGSDKNGHNFFSALPGYHHIEDIKEFSHEGCRIKVIKLVDDLDPVLHIKEPFLTEYTETFNLRDIDPNSIALDEGVTGLLVFDATNAKKAFHCSAINKNPGADYNKNAGCLPVDDSSEQLRFSTKEYAVRFSKALKHAVILCGGKPSTF